jgi:hypothetical protein
MYSNKEITTHRITGARNDGIFYFTYPPISAIFSKTLILGTILFDLRIMNNDF